jgi:hypothetical protein
MCDPITLGSIALMAAGTGASMYGQNQVQEARGDAMAAERIRQNAFDQEAAAINETSRQRYDNFGQQQGERAQQLRDLYDNVQRSVVAPQAAGTPQEAAPTAGAGSVVARENAKQQGKTDQFNTQQAEAQGAMSSFGDLLGQKSREQARDAGKVGQIGNFKKGSSQALSYELDDANNAGNTFKTLGDLARGLGSVGVAAGLRAPMGATSGPLNLARAGSGGFTPYAAALPQAAPGGSLFALY